jgi:hypothetical protein
MQMAGAAPSYAESKGERGFNHEPPRCAGWARRFDQTPMLDMHLHGLTKAITSSSRLRWSAAVRAGHFRIWQVAGVIVVRIDSAYYVAKVIAAIGPAGAAVLRHDPDGPQGQGAIAAVPESAWTAIEYPQAIWDDHARYQAARLQRRVYPVPAAGRARSASSSGSPARSARAATGTSPPCDTRLGSSNTALIRARVCDSRTCEVSSRHRRWERRELPSPQFRGHRVAAAETSPSFTGGLRLSGIGPW